MTDEDREHLQTMLAALLAAYDELDEDARTAGTDEEAIKRATRLLEALQGRTNLTARWRATFTLRFKKGENLSYQKLADRLGWSKERSVQIIRKAKKQEAEDASSAVNPG